MRAKIITIVACLLLIAGLSGLEQILVSRITGDALAKAQTIMEEIRSGEMEEAIKKAHALDGAWDQKAKLLELLVDHSATDDVRYALSKMIAALESSDHAAALVYAGELEGSIEHVRERQSLMPENLL